MPALRRRIALLTGFLAQARRQSSNVLRHFLSRKFHWWITRSVRSMEYNPLRIVAGCYFAMSSLVVPAIVAGQNAKNMAGDSSSAHVAMADIFEKLDNRIAMAAIDGAIRPWDIRLPSSSSVRWDAYRAHLLLALRARPVAPADSVASYLSLGKMEMRGDTLVVDFILGGLMKCKGEWTGTTTTSYETRAIRNGKYWAYPIKTIFAGEGLSLPCMR